MIKLLVYILVFQLVLPIMHKIAVNTMIGVNNGSFKISSILPPCSQYLLYCIICTIKIPSTKAIICLYLAIYGFFVVKILYLSAVFYNSST